MKIALLGASNSGKTVYFSGLYHQYRNVIASPPPTRSLRQFYELNGINTRVGIRLLVNDTELDHMLSGNARLLAGRPMQWPESTDQLNQANISVQFDFTPLQVNPAGEARHYKRDFELSDPAGGVFFGRDQESDVILEKLRACDAAIAFFPADVILEAVDTDDPEEVDGDLLARIAGELALGVVVNNVMMSMNKTLGENDIFPICFVITKADKIPKNKLDILNAVIFNHIIRPFSEANKKFMVCVCPISVVNAETGNFKAHNLEWPFLFAAQSVIIRNANKDRKKANSDFELSEFVRDKADRLNNNLFAQCLHFIAEGGETVGDLRRRSDKYLSSGHQKMGLANDDNALAKDILSSIAAEKRVRGITILMAGCEADPKMGAC